MKRVKSTLDLYLEAWDQHCTTEDLPPAGLYSGACVAIPDSVYICCGYDGGTFHDFLHELVVSSSV